MKFSDPQIKFLYKDGNNYSKIRKDAYYLSFDDLAFQKISKNHEEIKVSIFMNFKTVKRVGKQASMKIIKEVTDRYFYSNKIFIKVASNNEILFEGPSLRSLVTIMCNDEPDYKSCYDIKSSDITNGESFLKYLLKREEIKKIE